jgi:hypothetical protein
MVVTPAAQFRHDLANRLALAIGVLELVCGEATTPPSLRQLAERALADLDQAKEQLERGDGKGNAGT